MSTTATTTKDKVKEMFKSGQILTSCGAAKDFLTADLRRIITTLKKEGMDIVDRWATSTTSKRYKEYFLREFTPKDEPIAVVAVPPVPVPEPAPIEVPAVNSIQIPDPKHNYKSFTQQQLPFGT